MIALFGRRKRLRFPLAKDAFPLILLLRPAREPNSECQKDKRNDADYNKMSDVSLFPKILAFSKLPSADQANHGYFAEVEEA